MNEKLVDAQDIFLGKINHLCNKFGLNNVMAQLYAVLYFNNKPMSLDEMAERLKISKGSVSVNIRGLERYGVVHRTWVKGTRKDYYEAEPDIYKVITDRIKSMTNSRLSELGDMINESCRAINSVEVHDKETTESVRVFKQKLDQLKSLHDKASSLFELMNSTVLNSMFKGSPVEAKKA